MVDVPCKYLVVVKHPISAFGCADYSKTNCPKARAKNRLTPYCWRVG